MVIRLSSVNKHFNAVPRRGGSLKEAVVGSLAVATRDQVIRALRDVSLEIARGEAVGIVGANGSGKSTMLKLIAGVTEPTSGTVETAGRVLGVIELSAGFHDELSGEENVRLQAAIYGLSARDADALLDPVFAYAELGSFRTMPLKHYSSGMIVRLGFSIAIHCRPDVLLVDEVLAVGDQTFQEKCLRTIAEMRAEGKTIVFVTHQMEFAERICNRIVWLKQGAVHRDGPAAEVLGDYHREMLEREYAESEGDLTLERASVNLPGRFGTSDARIADVRFVSVDGETRHHFAPGEPFAIEIDYTCMAPAEEIDCSLTVDYEDGTNVAFWRAGLNGATQRPTGSTGQFRLSLPDPPFLPGRYVLSIALSKPGGKGLHYDLLFRLHHFAITAGPHEVSGAPIRVPIKIQPS